MTPWSNLLKHVLPARQLQMTMTQILILLRYYLQMTLLFYLLYRVRQLQLTCRLTPPRGLILGIRKRFFISSSFIIRQFRHTRAEENSTCNRYSLQ